MAPRRGSSLSLAAGLGAFSGVFGALRVWLAYPPLEAAAWAAALVLPVCATLVLLRWGGGEGPGRRLVPPGMGPRGGGSALKNAVALGMAKIAGHKERKKAAKWSLPALEGFHRPDMHRYWNESFYWNGCDLETGDRIISRVSHRGMGGDLSFVFLLLDIQGHGPLTLERDHLKAEKTADGHPAGAGLVYTCVEPMETWRVTYEGPLLRGHKPILPAGVTGANVGSGGSGDAYANVKLNLTYTNESPTFWYMRDDCKETLARNLSEEPWGWQFFKYCLNY